MGFLDFIHRPEFQILENTAFQKLDLFSSLGEWEVTYYVESLGIPDDGHRPEIQ
jgi:hypothetical protein